MQNLKNQILGFVLEELGYSRLRVLSFRLINSKITELKLRMAILRGAIRKKYKSSRLRIRLKDFVILRYTQKELEPYYVYLKLTPFEKEWIENNYDTSELKEYLENY